MPWLKISIDTSLQHAEPLADLLAHADAAAVMFEDAGNEPLFQLAPQATPLWQQVKVNALFSTEANIDAIIAVIELQLPELSPIHYILETIADQDWVRTTQSNFKPQCFGDNLWVCPEWCNDEALHGTIVTLDPGLAFGTGNHPTTALCLEWLAKNPPRYKTIIDYGCGSGILAIAALALGATKAIACDHDPQAIQATHNNAELNSFVTSDNLTALLPEQMPKIKTSLIMANILANPLIELAPTLTTLLDTNGTLVLSGLLTQEIAKVMSAYANEFDLVQQKTQEEWALLELRRKIPL